MRRGWVATAFVALGGLAGAGVTLIAGFLFIWNCSSGDGGDPYVADDSAQADVCGASGDGLILVVVCLVVVGLLAAAAHGVGRAWVEGRRSPLSFAGLVLLVALTPIVLIYLASAPSDECDAADQAAYEEWLADGGHGEAPADCASY